MRAYFNLARKAVWKFSQNADNLEILVGMFLAVRKVPRKVPGGRGEQKNAVDPGKADTIICQHSRKKKCSLIRQHHSRGNTIICQYSAWHLQIINGIVSWHPSHAEMNLQLVFFYRWSASDFKIIWKAWMWSLLYLCCRRRVHCSQIAANTKPRDYLHRTDHLKRNLISRRIEGGSTTSKRKTGKKCHVYSFPIFFFE